MDVVELHRRTVETFVARVAAVDGDRWGDDTPCREWTVRDLVNHVVGEDRWTAPLLDGRTIEEVGSAFDGDLLGTDPAEAAESAAAEAVARVAAVAPGGGKVHLSYGDEDVAEYVHQLAADHLIHAWDLAVTVGGDTELDPELVDAVGAWYAAREVLYRGAGVIGPRAPVAPDAGPAADLLAAFGRDPTWGPVHTTLARFSAAFGRGDVEAIMALMTDDCRFESTSPPDGEAFDGAEAVAGVWRSLFGATAGATFTEEASFVAGDHAVLRWRFDWAGDEPGHVRGVDVMVVRDGKVAEKLSYVKG